MTNKHTEGPWVYDDTWGLITAENGAVEVAACHAGRGGDAKANARLIAAAPDLLRKLERLVVAYETRNIVNEDIESVKTLITKAKGEL